MLSSQAVGDRLAEAMAEYHTLGFAPAFGATQKNLTTKG